MAKTTKIIIAALQLSGAGGAILKAGEEFTPEAAEHLGISEGEARALLARGLLAETEVREGEVVHTGDAKELKELRAELRATTSRFERSMLDLERALSLERDALQARDILVNDQALQITDLQKTLADLHSSHAEKVADLEKQLAATKPAA